MAPSDQKWGWADPFGSTLPWRRPLWQWLDLALEVARPCFVMELVQDMQVCLAALEVMLQKRAARGNMLEQAQHRTQRTQRGARATEVATELGGCSGRRSPGERRPSEPMSQHVRCKMPLVDSTFVNTPCSQDNTHIEFVARKSTHQISVVTQQ